MDVVVYMSCFKKTLDLARAEIAEVIGRRSVGSVGDVS